MLLYHGSTMAVRKPIVSRGRGKTDFGKGFYTTTSREQAEKWAQIKRDRMGGEAHAIVSVFELDDAVLNNPAYHTRHRIRGEGRDQPYFADLPAGSPAVRRLLPQVLSE